MSIRKFAAGALALAAVVSSGRAQEVARPASAGTQAAEPARELEAKALSLLQTAVADAQALRLTENRVRVQVTAAGLLWSHDEEAARALLSQATEGIRALLVGLDPADPQSHEKSQIVWQLRTELLQAIAQRDPKLALDFLRATRQPPFLGQQHDQELALELDLAARVAAQDPREAARLIEEGVRRGLTPNLINALSQLAQKEPAEATKLTTAAIGRLNSEDLLRNYETLNAAVRLVHLTTPPEPTPQTPEGQAAEGRRGRRHSGERIAVAEETRRALFETVVAALLGSTPDRTAMLNDLMNALKPLMPEVERYLPARMAALRRRAADMERMQDPRGRAWNQHQHLFQPGVTLDAMLEGAAKAPPEIRDEIYVNAVWRAHNEDPERARQIVEHVSNPQQRAHLLQELDRQRPWRAAEKGDFEQARQYLATLPTPERRAEALIMMSRSAMTRDQKKLARELLEEARAQFPSVAQNGGQFGMQLEIASAYAALDPAETFAIVESLISQLNELIAAAALVDGFAFNAFKEGELTAQGGYLWADFIRRCAVNLAAVAKDDFDRATAAARKFERNDARVIAELHLAQQLLSNQMPARREGVRIGQPGIITLRGRNFIHR
jgi:hypothetical protein